MRKLYIIPIALILFSFLSVSALAFETDNSWKMFVSHWSCEYKSPGEGWYKLSYNESYSTTECWDDPYTKWVTATGDGKTPIRSSGSDAVYFRKTINWNNEDLWFRAWEGNGGECWINEKQVTGQHIHLSEYLNRGSNLVACKIWGEGKEKDNHIAYFYGHFIPVSDSQLAWSNDWARWVVTERPVNSGTEARFYYCFDSPAQSYGCFENSAWPWSSGGGTAFRKSFYLENTENSYVLLGTNVLDIYNRDRFWCSVNSDWTDPSSLVGFDANTHEKYNLKSDISSKVKQGMNNINCWVSTYADPNPKIGGYKKFDLGFVQNLQVLGLKEYSLPITDPTIWIKLTGSGAVKVYAELYSGTEKIGGWKNTGQLDGSGQVPITLPVKEGKYTLKITAVFNDFGLSIEKEYTIEFTEPAPVLVDNPFEQSSGGGTEGSDTSSSGFDPLVPLTAGLVGSTGIAGTVYLLSRGFGKRKPQSFGKFGEINIMPPLSGTKGAYPKKNLENFYEPSELSAFQKAKQALLNPVQTLKKVYGEPSEGPGENLKTFWENTKKEEKYYNEVRVPEIQKRQAEIESIIKGFEEQAKKKREKEELEKITERMAWLNKMMLAGQLSTMQASKELRVLAGSPGIGYENQTKLLNMSEEFSKPTKIEEVKIEKLNNDYRYTGTTQTAVYDPFEESPETIDETLINFVYWLSSNIDSIIEWIKGGLSSVINPVYSSATQIPLIGPVIGYFGEGLKSANAAIDNFIYENREMLEVISMGVFATSISLAAVAAIDSLLSASAGQGGLAILGGEATAFLIGAAAISAFIDLSLSKAELSRGNNVGGFALFVSAMFGMFPGGQLEKPGVKILLKKALEEAGEVAAKRLASKWGKYAGFVALYIKQKGGKVTEEEIELVLKSHLRDLKALNNPELNMKITQLEAMDPFMTPAKRERLLEEVWEIDNTTNKELLLSKFKNSNFLIEGDKLDYITNIDKGKAKGFEYLGYTKDNTEELNKLLLEQNMFVDNALLHTDSQYGPKIEIVKDVVGPNGRKGRLTTVWILQNDKVRLVTSWVEPFS